MTGKEAVFGMQYLFTDELIFQLLVKKIENAAGGKVNYVGEKNVGAKMKIK